MIAPTQPKPSTVPLRSRGWATKRTPWWAYVVLAVLIVGGVLVALSRTASQPQRASDLAGYFGDVTAGVGSCDGGLRDSATAYQAVLGGDEAESSTAIAVIGYGASNCEVASNESLEDFDNYQVTESLHSLNLDTADNDVITWTFDATTVQGDMETVLKAAPGTARTAAEATLAKEMSTLSTEQATIDSIWNAGKKSTGSTAALPSLSAAPHPNQAP
ncbi:MAG TPA: hypothetical protein VI365_36760 [Trebonia sp.]